MNSSLPVSHRLTVVGQLASDTHADGATKNSDGIDMSQFECAAFVLPVGAVAGTGTVQLQQATTETFSDAKALRAPVSLTGSKPAQIGVRSDELDVNAGFRYVRAQVLGTGGSVKTGAVVLGLNARYQPAQGMADAVIVG